MRADYFTNRRLQKIVKTGELSLDDVNLGNLEVSGEDATFTTKEPSLIKLIKSIVPEEISTVKENQAKLHGGKAINAVTDFVDKAKKTDFDLGLDEQGQQSSSNVWQLGAPVAGSAAGTTLGASMGGVPGAVAGGLGGAGLGYFSSNDEAQERFQQALENIVSGNNDKVT